jgi:hypothetical protein
MTYFGSEVSMASSILLRKFGRALYSATISITTTV